MIIKTLQLLSELPDGTVIKELRGRNIAQLFATDDFRTWFYTGSDAEFHDEEVHLPVKVIHTPNPTPPVSCRCEFGWQPECPHHGTEVGR